MVCMHRSVPYALYTVERLCSLLLFSVVHCHLDTGDGMNFISTFGCSKETVTVETEGKITTIRSCNEDFGIAGISMEQTMNERWNYFEVKITDTVDDGEIGIGLGHKNYPLCNMPGWGIRSIGYHADDGGLYHERGFARLHGPTCSIGDTMGCGIDFTSSADGKVRVWFTKNDKVVFQPRTLDLLDDSESMFYPLICMRGSGQEVQYVGHQQKPYPTEKDSKLKLLLTSMLVGNIMFTRILLVIQGHVCTMQHAVSYLTLMLL